MPNRRQAIIWTNAGPIHWRIYAALGADECNISQTKHFQIDVNLVISLMHIEITDRYLLQLMIFTNEVEIQISLLLSQYWPILII